VTSANADNQSVFELDTRPPIARYDTSGGVRPADAPTRSLSQYCMDADDVEPAVFVKTLSMFLKFKDNMGHYKPHFATYEKFATIDFSCDISRRIFTTVETKKLQPQKTIKRNNRKFWYCECCDNYYQNLTKHVKILQHKMFALTKLNYAAVDAVIHDIRSESCQSDQSHNQISLNQSLATMPVPMVTSDQSHVRQWSASRSLRCQFRR